MLWIFDMYFQVDSKWGFVTVMHLLLLESELQWQYNSQLSWSCSEIRVVKVDYCEWIRYSLIATPTRLEKRPSERCGFLKIVTSHISIIDLVIPLSILTPISLVKRPTDGVFSNWTAWYLTTAMMKIFHTFETIFTKNGWKMGEVWTNNLCYLHEHKP